MNAYLLGKTQNETKVNRSESDKSSTERLLFSI